MAKQKGKSRGVPPGRLRIVAGKWRSRLLPVVDEPGLRPTSERIRETLFNWLAPTITGCTCVDLFAGSGALAFEALSRGARAALLVERSPAVVRQLRQNIETLKAPGAEVVKQDALAFLREATPQQFDLVFLDPPFAADYQDELCRLLQERGWVGPDSHVYLELARDAALPAFPAGWRVLKEKTTGNVRYMLIATGE